MLIKKLIFFFLIVSLMVVLDRTQKQVYALNDAHAVYISPENILFISKSKNWDRDKLKLLYQDLLLNGHGEELKTLTSVTVLHNPNKVASGAYFEKDKRIVLYNGKKNKTVDSMSVTLSHEYGHHFADTYVPDQKNRNSEWGRLRDDKDYPINWNGPYNIKKHMWQPDEIIAEDYVYFYGAQNKKKSNCNEKEYYSCETIHHENLFLTHPSMIKGMKDFWEKTSGVKVTNRTHLSPPKVLSITREIVYWNTRKKSWFNVPVITIKTPGKGYYYRVSYYLDNHYGYILPDVDKTKNAVFEEHMYGPPSVDDNETMNYHMTIFVSLVDIKTGLELHAKAVSINEIDLKSKNKIKPIHWIPKKAYF